VTCTFLMRESYRREHLLRDRGLGPETCFRRSSPELVTGVRSDGQRHADLG
jgi:hypothetical protein